MKRIEKSKNEIETGKKHFQAIYINWSYRIIGRVARIHKVLKATSTLDKIRLIGERKKTHVTTLKISTFEYSAIKIRANKPPPYSTLKPETNSASPSGRSKGARLVSARIEIIQGIKIGNNVKRIKVLFWIKSVKEKVWAKDAKEMIIKIILTS